MGSFNKFNKLIKLATVCLIPLWLSSCTRNINDSFCLLYKPVYLDLENDTSFTIQQVDENNIVYDINCNWN